MGVKIDLDKIEIMEEKPLQNGKSLVGQLRSAVYSPHFKKVVGIAMINKEYWDKKTSFELEINGKKSKGSVCDLPLVQNWSQNSSNTLTYMNIAIVGATGNVGRKLLEVIELSLIHI